METKSIKWVTEKEVEALRVGARQTRYPVRNELIILLLYRHGLRESELCGMRLDQMSLDESKIFIKRLKGGVDCTHPVPADELRFIKRYLRTRAGRMSLQLPWLFVSERGTPLHRQSVIKLVEGCYKRAGLRKITPHMLRHGCGYYLANKGCDLRVIQDYLGHKNINNTVIYTKLSGRAFVGLWE